MSRKPVPDEIAALEEDHNDRHTAFAGTSTTLKSANNPDSDPRADALVAEAEKLTKKFFGGSQKYEDACEKLSKAAAMYKINKNWQLAGDTYVKAAEIYDKQLKDENDTLNNYTNAAKAYKQCNNKLAMKYYQMSTNLLMEHNRFSSAAKLWKEVGELYEKDYNVKYAIEAYDKAAQCYDAEDSKANSSAMKIKVAQLAAELNDYDKAIEIYETVSKQALDTNVGRWSVTSYMFKAALCHFASLSKVGNVDEMNTILERYVDMHPQFDGTREIKLLQNCVKAYLDDDVDTYTDEVMRYDEILKLDNWTAKILLEIKNHLQSGGGGSAADDAANLQ